MNQALQYFTVAQAAEILGISPQRVRVLLAKGRLSGWQQVSVYGRVVWRVHLGLYRRQGKPGRPAIKRRQRKKNGAGDGKAKPDAPRLLSRSLG